MLPASRNGFDPCGVDPLSERGGIRMRAILILGALLISAAASAQIAVPPGQDTPSVPNAGPGAGEPGYGTPHSPRNAPGAEADETTGQAPKFDDRWPTGTPGRPSALMPGPPMTDRGSGKTLNPDDSKAGMDE
jgi:hypothetical protein